MTPELKIDMVVQHSHYRYYIIIIVREFMKKKSKVKNIHFGIYFHRIFTNIALEISKKCRILK